MQPYFGECMLLTLVCIAYFCKAAVNAVRYAPHCTKVLLLACRRVNAVGFPHVSECNYCMHCIMEDSAGAASLASARQLRSVQHTELSEGGKHMHSLSEIKQHSQRHQERQLEGHLQGSSGSGKNEWSSDQRHLTGAWQDSLDMGVVKPVCLTPHNLTKAQIGPADHTEKLLKPNCTQCYGCTTQLTDIKDEVRSFGRVKFAHGMGATNAWLFFAQPKGSAKRYIVKVYCMPYAKTHGRPKECSRPVYLDRIRLMMAQVALTQDCGVSELTPRQDWMGPQTAVACSH